MTAYLKRLQRGGWRPNFWCSEEYFRRADLEERFAAGVCGVFDEEVLVFPPLDEEGGFKWPEEFPDEIWSDFAGFHSEGAGKFLDWEFVYDPTRFLNMSGGAWMTFRKNSRKFPARLNRALRYIPPGAAADEARIQEVLIDWLEHKGSDAEISEGELMSDYVLEGDRRKVLLDAQGEVWGVNAWDENYYYVNFRFSVCRSEPFLSEYLRLLFYTDDDVLGTGKWVNDGGVLGSERLKFFKDKLNPIGVREVKQWSRRSNASNSTEMNYTTQ